MSSMLPELVSEIGPERPSRDSGFARTGRSSRNSPVPGFRSVHFRIRFKTAMLIVRTPVRTLGSGAGA
jgi:hypothetical protein